MSNTLSKTRLVRVGNPGSPGSPGIPPTDGYCYDVYTTAYPITWVQDDDGFWHALLGTSVTTLVERVCVPATSGTPGTPAIAPSISVDYQLGWNGGAYAIASMAGSGVFQFSVSASTVGAFVGLSSLATAARYENIGFALYFSNGHFRVYDQGAWITGDTPFLSSDVFMVRRLGSEVAYYQGTTLLYTSSVPAYGTLYADAVLYAAGDEIDNASLSSTVGATYASVISASGGGQLQIGARGVDIDTAYGAVSLRLTATGNGNLYGAGSAALKLTAWGNDGRGIYGRGRMVITASGAADEVIPLIAIGNAFLGPIGAHGYALLGNVGQGAVKLRLRARGASIDTGFGAVKLRLTAAGIGGNYGLLIASLPSLTLEMAGREGDRLGIAATLPKLTLAVGGQNELRATLPALTLAATATTIQVAHIAATLAPLQLAATMLNGTTAGMAAILPRLTLDIEGAAELAAELPSLSLAVTGTTGASAALAAVLPALALSASGTTGIAININAVLPALQGGGFNAIAGTLPLLRLEMQSGQTIVVSEGYCVNLTHPDKAVTHYTNWPFLAVVRYGSDYYGLTADTLYLLDGDKDGSAAIAWNFATGSTANTPSQEPTQGTMHRKRLDRAYWSGILSSPVTMGVSADDGPNYTYRYLPPDAKHRTHHIDPGKGLDGFYYRVSLAGSGRMRLPGMSLLQRELRRKA